MLRPVRVVVVAVAAVTIGACGSPASHISSPTPRKLSLVSSNGEAARASLYPQPSTTYVLDGPLAGLGSNGRVRRLVGHDVTAADVADLTDGLGMHAAPVRTEAGWELHDGDAVLSVGTSSGPTSVDFTRSGGAGSSPGSVGSGSADSGTGNTSVALTGAPSTPPFISPPVAPPASVPTATVLPITLPAPVDVPGADDAVNIAQSLLDGFGVLSGQRWAHDVNDAGGIAVSCAAGVPSAPTPPMVNARTVSYELLVDGVRVPGVGWSVTIGEHRRVESVSGTWAEPHDDGTYRAAIAPERVRRPEERARPVHRTAAPHRVCARPRVAPVATTVDSSPVPSIEVHITGVSLGVARWDGTDNARSVAYLVPTYRFHTRATGGSPSDIELLALDPASFALVAPPAPGGPAPGKPGGVVVPQPAPASGLGVTKSAKTSKAVAPSVVVSPATQLAPGRVVSVTGTHFASRRTFTLEECSQTSFVVMLHVCNNAQSIHVTTDRTGRFRSKLTVEVCPSLQRQTTALKVCYVGVVTLAGVDVDSLAGAAKITMQARVVSRSRTVRSRQPGRAHGQATRDPDPSLDDRARRSPSIRGDTVSVGDEEGPPLRGRATKARRDTTLVTCDLARVPTGTESVTRLSV